ncbi:hypothetical protein HGRIS_012192 [Hohenbuehelia grisea]|uniref:F-box domain-containing protein n=1 Tax=Hohenbuehelia grisea TaxID=104357 RepID=A0ABR3IRH6_9AGAR
MNFSDPNEASEPPQALRPIVCDIPLDILRVIFELSARSSSRMALHLSLVSRLIHNWMDTVIYDVVWIDSQRQAEKFVEAIQSKPSTFCQRIKVLCIPYGVLHTTAATILPFCPDLEGLACWTPEPLSLPSILTLARTRRLSLNICGSNGPFIQPDFSARLFTRITHLELFDIERAWLQWHGFEHMPDLTHLSVYWTGHSTQCPPTLMPFVARVFDACAKMRALVINGREFPEEPSTEGLRIFHDPRVVVMAHAVNPPRGFRYEWEAQWFAEPCMWDTADEIVALQGTLQWDALPPPGPDSDEDDET